MQDISRYYLRSPNYYETRLPSSVMNIDNQAVHDQVAVHFHNTFFGICKSMGIGILDLSPMGTSWHATGPDFE